MSIQSEISRIAAAVEAAFAKVIQKGGTAAKPYLVDKLAAAISTIPVPVLQSKSVTPATAAQTVKPDSGYNGLSQVTVAAMPTATQATPAITVSAGGLITAKTTQSAGYVAAGTKSATQQLTAQAAQTITPGVSDQTIAAGRYLTGAQTIKGDPNLKPGNIAAGVTIFGVTGTYTGTGPAGVTNWLPISTDASGNIYNSVGWKANTRYSASSNAESSYTGIYLSGYIPVEKGDVVRIKNVGLATTGDSARVNVVIFGTSKTAAWEAANVATLRSRFGAVLAADGVTVESFTIPDEGTCFIRFNASYLGDDSIVTVNEEI